MRRKIRMFKIFITLLCLINLLNPMVLVKAEDRPIPVTPVTRVLTGTPLVSTESTKSGAPKFLRLGDVDGSNSLIEDPFGKRLIFPVTYLFRDTANSNILPSDRIFAHLTTEFQYWEWDLRAYPQLQLTNHGDYILHVGGATGLPSAVRWGIRRTGKTAYENWPIEHVVDYKNSDGEWVRLFTRGLVFTPLYDNRELWGTGQTINDGAIYWELKQDADVENFSPIINGIVPNPQKELNIDSVGKIDGILINREEIVGNDCDLLSGITVVGAVTGNTLSASDVSPIPTGHFKIEHDTTGIDHLITQGKYTSAGSGEIITTVTDYENDVTIFKQKVVVENSLAKVRIKNTVKDNLGKASDIFLIHLKEDTLVGSIALAKNEVSPWMTLDMNGKEHRAFRIQETVPMNYLDDYAISIVNTEGSTAYYDYENDELIVKPDDEVTVVIENQFKQTGYFKGKDIVKNIFFKLL